ncbi:uncharacterized protein LOC117318099 [Pecten maximus]|uniref:uncharacterized protein LOC117318099 n=1 Tax=Pecten maximus TaxID=6579 RepID=UPI0014589E9C|nr:uncharacterized protein LOC117318099 [Pecten maximus]
MAEDMIPNEAEGHYAFEALDAFLNKEDPNSWESMTLQVVFCNPLGGYSFREAVVTTQEMLSTFNCYPDQATEENRATKRQKSISDEENIAFDLLDNYLKVNAGATESSFDRDQKEASITEVLNTHLFSHLAVGDCVIDDNISTSGKCSCGCGVDVKRGNNFLGLDLTWHGNVNMMINGVLPLTVLEDEDNTFKFEEQDLKWSSTDDMKKDISELSLKHKTFKSQLIAETITNAFAQTNANVDLLGLPIPAFGCTPDKICVYSYDCKNDILLKKMDILKIDEEHLTALTIVKIWLYLNFSLFMRRDSTDLDKHPDLGDYRAKFLSCNENVPRFYSKIQPGALVFSRASYEPSLRFVGLRQ